MYAAQMGTCYLGGEPLAPEDAVIEHDHRCCPLNRTCRICRRGLSCQRHNLMVDENVTPDELRLMADNLEMANRAVEARMASARQQELFPQEARPVLASSGLGWPG